MLYHKYTVLVLFGRRLGVWGCECPNRAVAKRQDVGVPDLVVGVGHPKVEFWC